MTLEELSIEERLELKQNLMIELLDMKGLSPSYFDLACVDDVISDQELKACYGNLYFVPEDFACNCL